MEIEKIDRSSKTVFFDDGDSVNLKKFIDVSARFFKNRVAGETIYFADTERFMRRTSGKNLTALMRGKKAEGYMEGSMDKVLTKGRVIAIGTVIAIIFIGIILYIFLKNQGVF